jgi:hypothetical protein
MSPCPLKFNLNRYLTDTWTSKPTTAIGQVCLAFSFCTSPPTNLDQPLRRSPSQPRSQTQSKKEENKKECPAEVCLSDRHRPPVPREQRRLPLPRKQQQLAEPGRQRRPTELRLRLQQLPREDPRVAGKSSRRLPSCRQVGGRLGGPFQWA